MKKIIPIFLSVFLIISMCACSSGGKNVKFSPKLNEPFVVTAKTVSYTHLTLLTICSV